MGVVCVGGEREGTDHDDERAAVEEPAVEVRDEPDRERADRSRDVALVAEARAGEMVRDPSDARNCDKKILQADGQQCVAASRYDNTYQFLVLVRGMIPQTEEQGVQRHGQKS